MARSDELPRAADIGRPVLPLTPMAILAFALLALLGLTLLNITRASRATPLPLRPPAAETSTGGLDVIADTLHAAEPAPWVRTLEMSALQ